MPDPVPTSHHDRIHDQVPRGHGQPAHRRYRQNPLPGFPLGWHELISDHEGWIAHHEPGHRDKVGDEAKKL